MDAGDGMPLSKPPQDKTRPTGPSQGGPGLALRSAIVAIPFALAGTVWVMMRSDVALIWALPIYALIGLLVMGLTMVLALLWDWFGL